MKFLVKTNSCLELKWFRFSRDINPKNVDSTVLRPACGYAYDLYRVIKYRTTTIPFKREINQPQLKINLPATLSREPCCDIVPSIFTELLQIWLGQRCEKDSPVGRAVPWSAASWLDSRCQPCAIHLALHILNLPALQNGEAAPLPFCMEIC